MQTGLLVGFLRIRGHLASASIALLAATALAACGDGAADSGSVATSATSTAAADGGTSTTATSSTSSTTQTLTGTIGSPPTTASDNASSVSTSSTASTSTTSTVAATPTTSSSSSSTSATSSTATTSTAASPTTSTGTTVASTPVASTVLRTALLSWTPPLQNTDGSMLTDLAGYRVYTGQDPFNLKVVADLAWGGYLWVQLKDLNPGTWYFSIRSYNSLGIESDFATVVSKTVA